MFKKAFGKRKAKNSQSVSTGFHPSSSGTSQTPHPDFNGSLEFPQSKIAESGPLGLSVVYTPDNAHKVDIVFVHGLGGTSRWTWSKYKNLELFWPSKFLPLEPDICLARIMTFGYNASINKASGIATSVLDFAKDLLYDLKYAKDQYMEDLEVGKVPLIFVVHSMGGLIVKEAYIEGQNDPEYESIIKAISAVIFLATPHRGTSLAQTLNRILDSIIITSSKQYIADLGKNSLALQKLNEQFRHIAPRLDIVSFYETRPTPIGLKSTSVMVVKKESSVLGYPGEISKALDADHHSICKYEGPHDPNYIIVRNILKSLVSRIISKSNAKKPELSNRRALLDLKSLLAISETSDIDYILFRDKWAHGTNNWIIDDKTFQEWRDASEPIHRLLWLSGGAATGKSIMSSFIVNKLVDEGVWSQYFFIMFGDRKKRTLSLLLRSLLYQIAKVVPGFLQKITELVDEGIMDFESADPRIIWDRVFKSILFKLEERQPLYWIIDGLDEAEDPRAVIKMLSDISSSFIPIRILFTSRRTSEIMTAFERVPQKLGFKTISIEGHLEDLRQYIRQELNVPGSVEFKNEIEQRIVEGAHSNFLWVRLAVDKVNQCHTHAAVDLALREHPVGMNAIYDRMALSIAENTNASDKSLATRILECVTCSVRVLKVAELSQALGEVTSEMLDLQRTIMDLCGGFVVVDNNGNVAMIHQTAHDYLLSDDTDNDRSFNVNRQAAHRQMFLSSMQCLMSTGLRARLNRDQKPEFLEYASNFWFVHLISAAAHDNEAVATLKKFLVGNWVLTWIHVLAASGQLRVLIRASKDLSKFASKGKHQNPSSSIIHEYELFESWAVDLLRIVGKFSNLLRRKSDSIYKFIPPFCPKSSSIYQLFGKAEAKNLSVSGLSAETWDDSLARIPLGTFASSITTAGSQIAVLTSPGNVFLYDSSDFREAKASPIRHSERVDKMQLNNTATLLATYGYRTTKVWEISTGICKISVDSVESKTRPLAMIFTNNNSTLLVCTDDRRVRSLNLKDAQPAWEVIAELEEAELEGHFMNAASHMALSNDGSMVAIAYRSHPLSAWETDGPMHIRHCWRQNEAEPIRELRELVWHPHLPEILGLNLEGVVFRWAPYGGEIEELPAAATKLSISKDGDLFVTGDGHGRVKLYKTSTFSLLYQLAAQDTVFGLTFSPDSKRFYDIRGYYANVWEPNALIRLAEQSYRDMDSISETQSSDASIAISGAVDSITALAGSPHGRLYCYGTERGVVSLHDTQNGKLADLHVSKAKFTIEKIAWSGDGKYICFTDMSKQVTVMSVTPGVTETEPVVEQKVVIPMRRVAKGPVLQLLFQANSSHLLVHTSSQICTISLTSSLVEQIRELQDIQSQWIVHPGEPGLIVGFGPSAIYVFDWDLNEHQKYGISWPVDNSSDESNAESTQSNDTHQIDRVLVTCDKQHLFLQTSHPSDHSRENQFFFLETSAILISTELRHDDEDLLPSLIYLNTLSLKLSSDIALALSFLFRDRLVYLSKGFAICSVQIPWGLGPSFRRGSSSATITTMTTASRKGGALGDVKQELFALPGDWISRDCLMVTSIWGAEKSLLCPRNGEAAVVRCAAFA